MNMNNDYVKKIFIGIIVSIVVGAIFWLFIKLLSIIINNITIIAITFFVIALILGFWSYSQDKEKNSEDLDSVDHKVPKE